MKGLMVSPRPIFPLIFQSLCAHKISFVQYFTRLICIWNDMTEICAKLSLEGTFMCAPSFLVCAHLTARVRAHSLEGTLTQVKSYDRLLRGDHSTWKGPQCQAQCQAQSLPEELGDRVDSPT